jgi:hypothetical protein
MRNRLWLHNTHYSHIIKLLSALLLLSFAINLLLWKPAFFYMSRSVPNPFPLNDPEATYVLKKHKSGEYGILYKKTGEEPRGAFVGSTQVPLDIGNQEQAEIIKIEGDFRPITGLPTCYKPCPANYQSTVIDIKRIQLSK